MDPKDKKRLLTGVVLMLAGVALIWLSARLGGVESSTPALPTDDSTVCIQVITSAKNPESGEVVDFPTPCDVPEGWEIL